MARPIILVAGDKELHDRLVDTFSPSLCTISHVHSFRGALDGAPEASLLVANARLPGAPGGGVDLCRRLRSDPVTTHLPLILRVDAQGDHVQALSDVRVVASDFAGLVRAVRELCPDLDRAPGELLEEEEADDNYFGESPTTVLFRRPEAAPGAAVEWPPPPPVRAPGQDLLEFAQVCAGYLTSLIEGLEDPGKLSAPELVRLHQMSGLALEAVDQQLTVLQTAATEALVKKDLERMKVLSAAKNTVYDRVQQLRSMQARSSPDPVRVRPAEPNAPPAAAAKKAQKSELTRAAEAKAAAQAADKAQKPERPKPEKPKKSDRRSPPPAIYRSQTSAVRREPGSNRTLIWVALGMVVVGSLVTYYMLRSGEGPAASAKGNQPPVMKWVQIEQMPREIVVRAHAEDPDRDPLTFNFRWLVNDQEIQGQTTGRLSSSYVPGDTVKVEVRAADARQQSLPMPSRPLRVREMGAPDQPEAEPPSAP